MFKLDQNENFWFPVSLELTGDEGKKLRMDFDAQFKRIAQSEITALLHREEGEAPPTDQQIVDAVFVGWRKVQDADGAELPVNAENRTRLLDTFPVRREVVRAWLKSIGIEGKAKN